MSKIKYIMTHKKNNAILTLTGVIDDDFNIPLETFPPWEQIDQLTIDLDNIDGLNSCGIRRWVDMLNNLPKDLPLCLVNCPEIFLDQTNITTDFLSQQVIIESFYLGFGCGSCDFEENIHVHCTEYEKDQWQERKCSQCSNTMFCYINSWTFANFLAKK